MPNSESHQLITEESLLASSSGGRRSSSFSSLSTLSFDSRSQLSPETILQFQGVPFSWEKLPGIPKSHHETQQTHKKWESSSANLPVPLPLPPPPTARLNRFTSTDHNARYKKSSNSRDTLNENDPFLAAFVECCRDENHQKSKNIKRMPPTRTNHGFGLFSLYAICKTSGPVADSIVYMPKSNRLF